MAVEEETSAGEEVAAGPASQPYRQTTRRLQSKMAPGAKAQARNCFNCCFWFLICVLNHGLFNLSSSQDGQLLNNQMGLARNQLPLQLQQEQLQ